MQFVKAAPGFAVQDQVDSRVQPAFGQDGHARGPGLVVQVRDGVRVVGVHHADTGADGCLADRFHKLPGEQVDGHIRLPEKAVQVLRIAGVQGFGANLRHVDETRHLLDRLKVDVGTDHSFNGRGSGQIINGGFALDPAST